MEHINILKKLNEIEINKLEIPSRNFIETDNLILIETKLKTIKNILNLEKDDYLWDKKYPLETTYMACDNVSKSIIYKTYKEGFGMYQILHKDSNIIIGDIGFINSPNIDNEVEIGYGISSNFYNKGITTEAVMELIKWSFEEKKINKIFAIIESSNISSKKVLIKSGFKKEFDLKSFNIEKYNYLNVQNDIFC
jgi:ribosomal-protein-alanine N-acetyltransferase